MNIRRFPVLTVALLAMACSDPGPRSGSAASADRRLVNGRAIPATMPAVRAAVGSLPMNMVMTGDGRWAVVSDMGYRQALTVIDVGTGKSVASAAFNRSAKDPARGLYYGLAVTADNRVYAANGAKGEIACYQLGPKGELMPQEALKAGKGDFLAGLALDGRGVLFAANNDPTGEKGGAEKPWTPGGLVSFDSRTGRELGRVEFESYLGTSVFPLAVAALANGSKVYVSSQRDGCVYVVDAREPGAMKVVGKIETGAHPAALLLDPAGKRLFVANASSDTVSQIDTRTDKVVATVLLRPEAARDVAGVGPLGMALSPGGKRLYVACADLNAVAVLEMDEEEGGGEHELMGYVPAGWYPTAVATHGTTLLIADGKGSQTRYPNPPPPSTRQVSPNDLVEGDVLTRPVPTKGELKESSREVVELARVTPRYVRKENPLAYMGVKHVIYIVKENRTYDQVLGDLPQGNGDPGRCIFGREVTPNQHALAERFVLLDNFYDCGEVSGDGWVWSTQAHANEYVIKNVPYQYSGRGRMFDYEGTNNGYPTGGFPAKGPDGEAMSEHPLLKDGGRAIPDVAEAPGGHLWDLAKRHGMAVRNYGFFVGGATKGKGGMVLTPDNHPSTAGLQPGGHDLEGVTDVDFRRFDMDFADSDAPQRLYEQTGNEAFRYTMKTFGKHKAASRFAEWKVEFDQMIARGQVPGLMLVRLCNDHTVGMSGGKHSPRAMVADNDYAVGQLVEAVSRSPIWKDTAIVIIEDDAQNGPDHVDAHRSTCYVVSPWVKRGAVDHTFHNTVSALRTIECLLGLPPMNAFDAGADPMRIFDAKPANAEPFTAILPEARILSERNPRPNVREAPSPEARRMILESERMNFAIADKAPAERLTEIIWASVKGTGIPQPPTPHGPALPGMKARVDDDDE